MRKVKLLSRRISLKMFTGIVLPLILVLSLCLPVQAAEPEQQENGGSATGTGTTDWYAGQLDLDPLNLVCINPAGNKTEQLVGYADTQLISDGFEGSFPGSTWALYSSSQYGPFWGRSSYKPYTGSYSAWCAGSSASNNYPANFASFMIAGPFDLSQATSGTLTLYRWIKTQAAAQGDPYSGDSFWTVASTSGPTTNLGGWVTSGQGASWEYRSYDLTNWGTQGNLCGHSSVYLGFVFDSNNDSVTDKGVFVDEVRLTVENPTNRST
jgi:hypothetical protein